MYKIKISSQQIGPSLALLGAAISALATFINNVLLDPTLARQIWWFSNPIILAVFIGQRYKKWNGGLSNDIMIGLYIFYVITNTYAIFVQ